MRHRWQNCQIQRWTHRRAQDANRHLELELHRTKITGLILVPFCIRAYTIVKEQQNLWYQTIPDRINATSGIYPVLNITFYIHVPPASYILE